MIKSYDFFFNFIRNSEILKEWHSLEWKLICQKWTETIFFYIFRKYFFIIPMGAKWYICPIRLVPTYILPATGKSLLGRFHNDSFRTEIQVCVETDRRTDKRTDIRTDIRTDRRTWLDRLVCDADLEYICFVGSVVNFWLKSLYPLQGYAQKLGTFEHFWDEWPKSGKISPTKLKSHSLLHYGSVSSSLLFLSLF